MAFLAYSPNINIAVESYVATYHIYILKHPETGEVFYVGKTTKDLKTRLSGHLSDTGLSTAKGQYLQKLFDAGLRPEIEAIETIHGTCYIDKVKLSERELFWIKYFKNKGVELTNIAGIEDDAKSAEYHGYLASIKRGESQWKYYYCGKTKYGIAVYDEEKLNEDGFELPTAEPTAQDIPNYEPPVITYDRVYSDEDPNYIVGSFEEY